MPTAIVPGIYDEKVADRNLWIETEDCHQMVKRWRAKKACSWASRAEETSWPP